MATKRDLLLEPPAPNRRLRRAVQRLGEELLIDALERTLSLRDTIGVFAVVVDALSEAAAGFYARFGFTGFPSEPLRLFLPIATSRRRSGGGDRRWGGRD